MNVLVTDRFTTESLAKLRSYSEVNVLQSQTPYPDDDQLKISDALLIRSRTRIDQNLIDKAPLLKFVVSATSGTDHIDFELTEKKNIIVRHTPDAPVQSVAELTLNFMLLLIRETYLSTQIIKKHKWRDSLKPSEQLNGKTLGLIGLGRIGKKVAQLANVFEMHVQAYDPYIDEEEFKSVKASRSGLIEILRTSDIVSLHVPLTNETRQMINSKTLEHFGEETYLINTSRGDVIDESALIEFLSLNKIKAAALDVFHKEPLNIDHPFLKLDNLILTPHIGAYTEPSLNKASLEAVNRLIELIQSHSLLSL